MRKFIVTIEGKNYEVGVEEVGVGANVAPVVTKIEQAPVKVQAPIASANTNGTKVVSPFPGLIKNLLVENGASVKKDQPIMILEAMKMDNDITSPCDGTVTFSVNKGANVETDAVLAIIG